MPVKHPETSEVYRRILHDFMNYPSTGFEPFGKNVGGVDHFNSSTFYEETMKSRHAFRSLAQKVAQKACSLLPNNMNGNEDDISKEDENDDDGGNKAAVPPSKASKITPIDPNDLTALDDDSVGGRIFGCELGQMRKPFLLEYPTRNKLGIVCCLDGDVEDRTSNEFRLSNDGRTMTRMRRVPKACSSGSFLLKGIDGEDKQEGFMPGFGSTDIDVQVIDSAIQKRLKNCKREKNGDIWEPRDVIDLPFPCMPTIVSKEGKAMKTFKSRMNANGFWWAYFWLVGKHAAKAAGASEHKRFGGTRVFSATDDASLYSYQTVNSKDVPIKHVLEKKRKKTKHTTRKN